MSAPSRRWKLWRCPHHGWIDGAHYAAWQEWGPEDGCPLLAMSTDNECAEEFVEEVEVIPVDSPNVLSVEEAGSIVKAVDEGGMAITSPGFDAFGELLNRLEDFAKEEQ